MYSSLLSIDIVSTSEIGLAYWQTDHRTSDEMRSEPEITTLFALTRILNPRAYAREQGVSATVVYRCREVPTPELVELLAAAGAMLEEPSRKGPRTLAPVTATPSELADAAFRLLAQRVCVRCGLTDVAMTVHALETETLANPLNAENEVGYWTRLFELAALGGELLRARSGGKWV